MLTRPLLPFFLDTYSLSMSSLECKALCTIIIFLIIWSICVHSSLFYFKNSPEYLTIAFWWDFCSWPWVWEAFSFFWGTIFLFFQSYPLVWWCPLPIISNSVVIFLLSKRFNVFLILLFYSFRCFSFPTFPYEYGIFFNFKFHSSNLVVYSYCLYQSF